MVIVSLWLTSFDFSVSSCAIIALHGIPTSHYAAQLFEARCWKGFVVKVQGLQDGVPRRHKYISTQVLQLQTAEGRNQQHTAADTPGQFTPHHKQERYCCLYYSLAQSKWMTHSRQYAGLRCCGYRTSTQPNRVVKSF